jgi:hypothetical protein
MKNVMFVMALLVCSAISISSNAQNSCAIKLEKAKLCGGVEFLSKPSVNVNAPFVLAFWNATSNGSYVIPAGVQVDLWMPAHGHGSRPTKAVRLERTGVTYVDNVFFAMPGLWQIRVRVLNAAGEIIDTANAEITL